MIKGKRTRLRLPENESDHELLVKWRNDETLKLYFYDDEPLSLESHMKWWAKVSADLSQRNYMIDGLLEAETKDRTDPLYFEPKYIPVGMTSLVRLDFINRTGEYGRLKIDPRYQGNGYAFDAEVALMRHAFNSLNLHRVWLHALSYNEAVIKLHEKTGFQHEGCLKEHIFKHGQYHDVVTMALLDSEFRAKFPAEVK